MERKNCPLQDYAVVAKNVTQLLTVESLSASGLRDVCRTHYFPEEKRNRPCRLPENLFETRSPRKEIL